MLHPRALAALALLLAHLHAADLAADGLGQLGHKLQAAHALVRRQALAREAEDGLRQLAAQSGLEVVIVRPVLVYGPGVKANFRSMMSWLNKGVPLPLGAIPNQRSLVALDNLVDLVVTCLDHAAAANQTFLVSDDDDMSTTELLKRMGEALQTPVRLIPVPAWLLLRGAALLGRKDVARRLCGSLQVDISKTRSLLGWTPPLTVAQALSKTARSFQESLKSK